MLDESDIDDVNRISVSRSLVATLQLAGALLDTHVRRYQC